MVYRIAVVEDDPEQLRVISQRIRSLLHKLHCPCTLLTFSSSFEALDLSCDAYLLDICMPGIDGIRLAQQIRASGNLCSILFISSLEARVFDALRVQPLRFVRKLHLDEDLPEAIAALSQELKRQGSNALLLQVNGEMLRVPVRKILYVESANKMQRVVLADHTYDTRSTMQDFEEQLSAQGFFRIHRCYLVNVSAIYSISAQDVTLDNGTRLPISRSKIEETKERLKRMMFA